MSDVAERLYERLLVLRCQAGDEGAFEEIVGRYGPRLRYFLGKMLGRDGGAEDALQEVWLDVWQRVGRLKDAGAFAAWVYRVARDRAYRGMRGRRGVVREIAEGELVEESAGEDFTAEDAERVNRALDELPAEQREVLVLRFVEDMSYEQIAGVVACPVGTVRSRLHYARRELRRVIERSERTDCHERG